MYKFDSKVFIYLFVTAYLFILFILPFNQHVFGIFCEIFPALDLAIVYYLSTHRTLQYWQLFIFGIFLDQLYTLPPGTNSFALIIAELGLKYSRKWFFVRNYTTNLITFCAYSIFVTSIKYLIVTVLSTNHIEGAAIFFYLITTILAYPAMYIVLEKSMNLLGR
ncbi:MAG: hypothetical protein Tsb006_0580 [Rickettsiaceae bacterium]